jgi:hypothetical protein
VQVGISALYVGILSLRDTLKSQVWSFISQVNRNLFNQAEEIDENSRNVWLTAQVLFDVLQDPDSPYRRWDPVFSVGVAAGF